MRNSCLNTVYEIAQRDSRIIFIGSDLGFGTLSQFREEMPKRFFMEGVSEANVVGMAAGLALEGSIVYVNTDTMTPCRPSWGRVQTNPASFPVLVRPRLVTAVKKL